MPLDADIRKFQMTIRTVAKHSRKAMPEILRNNMLKVLIGGPGYDGIIQLTPKATVSQIKEDMARMVTYSGPRGGAHAVPLSILLAAKAVSGRGSGRKNTGEFGMKGGKGAGKFGKTAGDKLWRFLVGAQARRIIAARLRGRTFISAGWLKPAMTFGARGGKTGNAGGAKLLPEGEASKSYGVLPSESRLVAESVNVVDGARQVSAPVIQRAIANAIKDMRVYIRKKLTQAIERARKT